MLVRLKRFGLGLAYLCLLILSGCSNKYSEYQLGFHADLNHQALSDKKAVSVYIEPIKSPSWSESEVHPTHIVEFKEEMRESFVRDLRQVQFLETSTDKDTALETDYRLHITWGVYDVLVNKSLFAGATFNCDYQMQLKLHDKADSLLMNKTFEKQAQYTSDLDQSFGNITEQDDLCYQARSYVVQNGLNEVIRTINKQ